MRSKRTRPLAAGAIVKASPAEAPLTSIVSKPSSPSFLSEPSPLFQTSRVVAGAAANDVVGTIANEFVATGAAGERIDVVAAENAVGAVAARDRVGALVALERQGSERSEPRIGGHRVVATQAVDGQALAGEVDEEQAEVHAVEAHPVALGLDRELVAGGRSAVHHGLVVAGVAVHHVVPVAVVPDEDVVAVAALHVVVAPGPGDHVVACSAAQVVGVVVAGQSVVAALAVDRCGQEIRRVDRDGIVAVAGVDDEVDRVVGRQRLVAVHDVVEVGRGVEAVADLVVVQQSSRLADGQRVRGGIAAQRHGRGRDRRVVRGARRRRQRQRSSGGGGSYQCSAPRVHGSSSHLRSS